MKEEHRDRRSVRWIETGVRDVGIAVRTLGRAPSFVLVTVLTLALGIGATAAVFSLIQGVLLTPPPYADSERLVLIPSARTDGQRQESPRPWPAAQWLKWQREAKSVQSIAAYRWMFNFLILPDGVESFEAMAVTPEYFSVVGLEPVLGRKFVASDTAPSAAPVLMIGYELWQRKFGGNPNILGQSVRISRQDAPIEIVGVMPPGVWFPAGSQRCARERGSRERARGHLGALRAWLRSRGAQAPAMEHRRPPGPRLHTRSGASRASPPHRAASPSQSRLRRLHAQRPIAHLRVQS